jgi:capsular exopolysaccharide synthesis family protein
MNTPRRATSPLASGEDASWLHLGRTLTKHWVLALAGLLFAVTATAFYTFSQPKVFRSSATLQIEPSAPRPLGTDVQSIVDVGSGSFWSNQEYYLTQYKIIQSRNVAEDTVRRLSLDKDQSFVPPPAPDSPGQSRPGGSAAPTAFELAADTVMVNTLVEPIKDSRLVRVKYDDTDPERARRILTTLVDVYLERNINLAQQYTTSGAEWLSAQLSKLKQELDDSERALHDYKSGKQILSVSLDDQSNMLREEIRQLNTSLTSVKARREAVAARVAELSHIDTSDPTNLPSLTLLDSPVLQTLRARYVDAKAERDALLGEGKGANHPQVVALQAKIETAKQALASEVSNVRQAANAELVATERELGGLARLFANAEKRALELNLLEIDYRKMERTKTNTEKLYTLVLEKTKETDLTRMMRFNNIEVVEAATLARAPVRPRVALNLAVGVLGGLALGFLLALGRNNLDRSLKSPEDIEQYLQLPYLGLLPRIGSRTRWPKRSTIGSQSSSDMPAELVVRNDPQSAVAEAARAIRTNIAFASPDRPLRSILITSSGPEEGKTTVASCLAITMAQAGQKVLLLDCDLRRPRLHRVFDRPAEPGVTHCILDSSALDSVLRDAKLGGNVEGLDVLPAGQIPPNPAELLHSASFKRLLDALLERYDRVILDSPPVAPVTDATILSASVDATLLVVRAYATDRETARSVVRTLREVAAPRMLGVVLNYADIGRGRYGYRYYYGKDARGTTNS